MHKTCRQCSAQFEITDEDLKFYDRVSPVFDGKKEPIPPPTLCPDCRQQRRMAWRNEHHLYRRQCDSSQRDILSIYTPESECTVYDQPVWWGDSWDGLSYGQSYDPARPFFDQWSELATKVPRLSLINKQSENADYCNQTESLKNCYLITGSIYSQDCYYGTRMMHCTNSIDCLWADHCELCYQCVDVQGCYNVQWGQNCNDVSDAAYVLDCTSSHHLLFCCGLHRRDHCILNKPVTQAELAATQQRLLESIDERKKMFQDYQKLCLSVPRKGTLGSSIQDSTGNYLSECKNVQHAFDVNKAQDCKFLYEAFVISDSYDIYSYYGPGDLCYEMTSAGVGMHHCLYSRDCWPGSELIYCDHCFDCHDCFGCVGLRNKSYCVLNKHYTKEEYFDLVPTIISRMRSNSEWGEFLPASLSPHGYNETVAQFYFPLTKEQALAGGFRWSDYEPPIANVDKTIKASKLPDSIDQVPDDVLSWAIECEATKKPFKIINQELEFYRRQHLPVPHLHPSERHRQRMALRNPRTLWARQCAKCQKVIHTTYSPDRPEIVYCDVCYLETVY